jgi:hypothetical protein
VRGPASLGPSGVRWPSLAGRDDREPDVLYIGGHWRAAASGATFPVTDPATGATIGEVADADAEDRRTS